MLSVFSLRYCLVVSTSAVDCLGRLVSGMIYYVSSGTLNHTLTHSKSFRGRNITYAHSISGVEAQLDQVQCTFFTSVCKSLYIARCQSHNMSVCCEVSVGLLQGCEWHWRIFGQPRMVLFFSQMRAHSEWLYALDNNYFSEESDYLNGKIPDKTEPQVSLRTN